MSLNIRDLWPCSRVASCYRCDAVQFGGIEDYLQHLQAVHLDSTWGCTLCSKLFVESSEEREHAKISHPHLMAGERSLFIGYTFGF
jgi:uncharacterized C2H2 Zn-finger protein